MGEKSIELRAHHLLCMPMFSGHGYSEDFCLHMYEIIKMLRTAEVDVRILASPDEACSHCPNLRMREDSGLDEEGEALLCDLPCSADERIAGRVCKHEGKTARKDRMLLQTFGLEAGRRYTAKEVTEIVLAHMNEQDYQRSCKNCQWGAQGLCSYPMWRENFPRLFGQSGNVG